MAGTRAVSNVGENLNELVVACNFQLPSGSPNLMHLAGVVKIARVALDIGEQCVRHLNRFLRVLCHQTAHGSDPKRKVGTRPRREP